MSVTLHSVRRAEEIGDRAALEAMLVAYMGPMLERFRAAGGPPGVRVEDALGDIWGTLPDFLPPKGALVVARDPRGALMGCGFLKGLPSGAGEMKRLYVDPAARGTGLGRRIVEARIEAARELGLTRLLADTVRGNAPMIRLYESFGFRQIPRYAENANPPEFAPYLVYFEREV